MTFLALIIAVLLLQAWGSAERVQYDDWFDNVSSTRPNNYAPPRIHVGSSQEPTTILTRQDWRGGTWAPKSIGHWEIHVTESNSYQITLDFDPGQSDEVVELRLGNITRSSRIKPGNTQVIFKDIDLPKGNTRLEADITSSAQKRGLYQAFVKLQNNS